MFTTLELNDLQQITSTARLSSYPKHLGTTNAHEAYGAYMWSLAVSTAFSPVINAVEVGFRNVLNHELSSHYGNHWFHHWVTVDANDQRAKGKLTPNQKSYGEKQVADAIAKITKRDHPTGAPAAYKPAWQRVLAEMTFGFWVTFLIKRFWDVNHNTKLWPNHTLAVFPGAPASMNTVGKLYTAFDEVVDIRNRIHHQEPLWKHHSVHTCSDALAYLTGQLASTLSKLDYLGRGQRSALEKYGVVAAIEELCKQSTFDRFVGRDFGYSKSYRRTKKGLALVRKQAKDNDCLWVTSEDGGSVQLVIRNGNRRFF